jgi:hypothetical protein
MKLWIDDREDAPEGWRRVRTATEAEALLRGGQVVELSLGGSALLVDMVAQAIEQGSFTGRIRPLKAVLRASDPVAERAFANAARHWAAMPAVAATPVVPARKTAKRSVLLRFVLWHLVGFAIALGLVEAWCQLRYETHAPIVERMLGK